MTISDRDELHRGGGHDKQVKHLVEAQGSRQGVGPLEGIDQRADCVEATADDDEDGARDAPTAEKSWGAASTPTHPTAMYAIAFSQRGESSHASSSSRPSAALVQTSTRTSQRVEPWKRRSANGV